MNDNWEPNIQGARASKPYRISQRQGNKLQDSDNPIVARIGEFIFEEPDNMPTGMRALGGLTMGLHLARMLDLDELDQLIHDIYSLAPPGAEEEGDRLARDCIEGTGAWDH
jgi:hypothetical protein